jgi:AmmeMemoRadiSam system protein A
MHPLVKLARQTIETYVQTKRVIESPSTPEFQETAKPGVFVSIHYKTGELRGCVGSFHTTERLLAEQVIHSAISACSRDPRFPPVRPAELPLLDVKVDVLSPLEPIDSPDELDVKRYGLVVESGWKRGLLLPDIPGVEDVEQQIEIAEMKAGIRPGEPIQMYRFTVDRYTEDDQ